MKCQQRLMRSPCYITSFLCKELVYCPLFSSVFGKVYTANCSFFKLEGQSTSGISCHFKMESQFLGAGVWLLSEERLDLILIQFRTFSAMVTVLNS